MFLYKIFKIWFFVTFLCINSIHRTEALASIHMLTLYDTIRMGVGGRGVWTEKEQR